MSLEYERLSNSINHAQFIIANPYIADFFFIKLIYRLFDIDSCSNDFVKFIFKTQCRIVLKITGKYLRSYRDYML